MFKTNFGVALTLISLSFTVRVSFRWLHAALRESFSIGLKNSVQAVNECYQGQWNRKEMTFSLRYENSVYSASTDIEERGVTWKIVVDKRRIKKAPFPEEEELSEFNYSFHSSWKRSSPVPLSGGSLQSFELLKRYFERLSRLLLPTPSSTPREIIIISNGIWPCSS